MQNLRDYLFSLIGVHYKWGGNNPVEGFDCSGLVCEFLRTAGECPSGDHSAQSLHDYFSIGRAEPNRYQFGALAFFGESVTKISHTGIVLDAYQMIEAGGGNHLTLTREDAMRQNAFVRMRPINSRSDFVMLWKPYYRKIGMLG